MAKDKTQPADAGKEVATVDGGQVATATGTALTANDAYAEYAGSGFENQTQDDYSIPFITILQALSPQLQEPDTALKQGMIFNTVTADAFPGNKGVCFVPALTQHEFIEFKPRDSGGGFVGRHAVDSEVVKVAQAASTEYGKYNTPDGNELIETFAVYGILINEDGSTSQAVVAFSASKIKKYKAWMTKAKTIQIQLGDGRRIPAPLFAHRYRLKTVVEKAPKGTFYNWVIEFDGANAIECRLPPTDPVFQDAVAIKSLLDSGRAKADYAGMAASGGAGGDGEESGAPAGKPVF